MIITLDQVTAFSLVFARFIGMIFFAPIFNDKRVLPLAKVALAFWISTLCIFSIPLPENLPETRLAFMMALIIDFGVGAMIGCVLEIIVSASRENIKLFFFA